MRTEPIYFREDILITLCYKFIICVSHALTRAPANARESLTCRSTIVVTLSVSTHTLTHSCWYHYCYSAAASSRQAVDAARCRQRRVHTTIRIFCHLTTRLANADALTSVPCNSKVPSCRCRGCLLWWRWVVGLLWSAFRWTCKQAPSVQNTQITFEIIHTSAIACDIYVSCVSRRCVFASLV